MSTVLIHDGSAFFDLAQHAVAVERLRMTVYIGHLMAQAGLIPQPLRLARHPRLGR